MAAPQFTLKAGDGFAARLGVDRSALPGVKVTFKPNITRGGLVTVDDGMELVEDVVIHLDSNGKLNGNTGIALLANDASLGLVEPLEWRVVCSGFRNENGFERHIAAFSFDAPGDGDEINLADMVPPPGQVNRRGPAAAIASGYFDENDSLILVNIDQSQTSPIELPDGAIVFIDNGDGTVGVG